MGDIIVLSVIGIASALAVRSLWKDRKKGGCSGCSHNCSHCSYRCETEKNV